MFFCGWTFPDPFFSTYASAGREGAAYKTTDLGSRLLTRCRSAPPWRPQTGDHLSVTGEGKNSHVKIDGTDSFTTMLATLLTFKAYFECHIIRLQAWTPCQRSCSTARRPPTASCRSDPAASRESDAKSGKHGFNGHPLGNSFHLRCVEVGNVNRSREQKGSFFLKCISISRSFSAR